MARRRSPGRTQTDLDGGEVAALVLAPHLAQLRDLRLALALVRSRSGGTAAAEAIARSPLRCLEHLDLANCRIDAPGIAALAAWPGLATVKHLWLAENGFGDAGGDALAASKYLASIEVLDVTLDRMSEDRKSALERALPRGATLKFAPQVDLDDR